MLQSWWLADIVSLLVQETVTPEENAYTNKGDEENEMKKSEVYSAYSAAEI